MGKSERKRGEERKEEKKTQRTYNSDHRLKWYLRHVHWSTWLLFVLILLFHFISYELFSHLETKQLKANNSNGNYSAKIESQFKIRLNTSGQRKNITLMKHRTTISKMKTAISFYFFSLISFGVVVFFPWLLRSFFSKHTI